MVKFRYIGKEPIYDIGLLLEQKNGADVDCNDIIKNGDIITTTDERCCRIMSTNPNYDLVEVEEKIEKPKKKNKKKKVIKTDGYTATIEEIK